jgi:hypothetical protein
MMDLFGHVEHDPRGKVKTALPAGIKGSAVFGGHHNEYRTELRRWIGDSFPEKFMVFIGMNSSTAIADANDPTITREWGFTRREGYDGFKKYNVSDYRATFPEDLLTATVPLWSAQQEAMIRTGCMFASAIVICHGKLLKPLVPLAEKIIRDLRADGHGDKLWCFGKNADGSAKHPLYLKASTPLVRF